MRTIRVVLAEAQTLFRQGIGALLRDVEGVEIVGEVANVEDAASAARAASADVVLMDQDAPNFLQTVRLFKETLPQVEVIVMTARLDVAKALQAVEAGATGYVLKDIAIANLVSALRSVCNGRAFVHPEVTRRLVERLGELKRKHDPEGVEGLTQRELSILQELAKGNTDREIASKLIVTEGTIKTHIRHILRKLKAKNRTQAVAHVLRNQFIE
jgi:DNA-binding NarL/FixJ family response regulator